MISQEWPIAASTAHGTQPSSKVARGRISTVRVDFFLNPLARLTEQERALMNAMLHSLVGDIAAELRAALPVGWLAANDEDSEIVDKLVAAGLLDDNDLIEIILRRANEERISAAARSRSGRTDGRMLQGLVSHQDNGVSSAAMALVLARGRRRDRIGQLMISLDDLPNDVAERLVFAVAAVLRSAAVSRHGPAASDSELGGRAAELLARRDPERSVDALGRALVAILDEAGGLTNEFLLTALQEGEIGVFAEVLGRRSGFDSSVALEELFSGSPDRVMMLMRVSLCSRDLAAGLLASLGDLLGIEDPGEALALFEKIAAEDVKLAASWLATPPSYRSAVEVLGSPNG